MTTSYNGKFHRMFRFSPLVEAGSESKFVLRSFIFSLALQLKNGTKKCLILLLFHIPLSAFAMPEHPNIDSVLIDKSQRKMYLISAGVKYREFYISLGDNPVGHKQQQGDERTPEGSYTIDYRNPNSRYHLSLHISYPNKADKDRAHNRGINPGGDIFIHGLPNGLGGEFATFRNRDWTDGCIALSNTEIKEIWQLVKNGTPIEIRP